MRDQLPVVIIGAGPYGLSAAAHLQARGVEPYVVGQSMGYWKAHMPAGMFLRSHFEASSLSDPHGKYSFQAYARASDRRIDDPVPIGDFIAYGEWFQRQVVPNLDARRVRNLSRSGDGFEIAFEDGDRLQSNAVVLALGLEQFASRPQQFAHVPDALAPHSSRLSDLSGFHDKRVAVIGAGQSGLEYAALLREQHADVQIITRSAALVFMAHRWRTAVLRALTPGPLRRFSYVVRPPTDLGDFRDSRVIADPEKFRKQPPDVQARLLASVQEPRGASWLRARLHGVVTKTDVEVSSVDVGDDGLLLRLSDGTSERVERVVLATGYQIDVSRYPILDAALHASIATADGYPLLTTGLETSVPGLYMTGVVGERTLGPTLRFVTGTSNASPRLAASIAARLAVAISSRNPV